MGSHQASDGAMSGTRNGTVLVGIDFSESALAASRHATGLAERLGAPLVRVHVVEPRDALAWQQDEGNRRWLADAGLEPAAIATRWGLPWVELTRCAAEYRAALLIAGSHGRRGYHPLALGSTAERLTIIAPCPVLVVRAGARARENLLTV